MFFEGPAQAAKQALFQLLIGLYLRQHRRPNGSISPGLAAEIENATAYYVNYLVNSIYYESVNASNQAAHVMLEQQGGRGGGAPAGEPASVQQLRLQMQQLQAQLADLQEQIENLPTPPADLYGQVQRTE